MLTVIGAGIWYSQQDEATQRHSQKQFLDALDWLVDLEQTNKNTDEFLNWIVGQMPASKGVSLSVDTIQGAGRYTFSGIPVSSRPLKILQNEGYLVGYDEVMRNPAWVAYRLESHAGAKTAERPNGFVADTRTEARVKHDDYTHSGYDRGHLAPNYGIGMTYGEAAQMETFLMSNIVPQSPDLNRGPWKELEQLIANEYLKHNRELWVITGPIYEEPYTRLKSGVVVPTAFFKILADEVDGGMRSLALIMRQSLSHEGLSNYLVSVDEIESITGLDFFSPMDDAVEAVLESARASRMW